VPGALPIVIGYIAATGGVDLFAVLLFVLQVVWQLPHSWSITWLWYEDYSRGGYDLMPLPGGKTRANALLTFLSVWLMFPVIYTMYHFQYIGHWTMMFLFLLTFVFVYTARVFSKEQMRASARRLLLYSVFYLPVIMFISCRHRQKKLPVLSKFEIKGQDTVYKKIPSFVFLTQDSLPFSSEKLYGKTHVADFFFTSCPGICPILTSQMKRLQEMTKAYKDLQFVSFTVDPHRDIPARLKQYALSHRADLHNWVFLTGPMDSIYKVGIQGYYLGMQKDSTQPGGYMHSGRFVLVDKKGLIRGYYDGTNAEEVNRLARDIKILMREQ